MAEEANVPAGEPLAPQTEANPITNANQAPEAPQTGSSEATGPSMVDLHGLNPDQLGDIAKFFESNGGFDKVKSRLSNPQRVEESTQASADVQSTQPAQTETPKTSQPPRGFASLQELSVERYFKDLAADPKYANISEQISNGEVLKEMAKMGMTPIDENYNINIDQLNQFLALKSASVPTQPTSVEPTNVPTVDYVPVEGDTITSMNQALDIVRQSTTLKAQGQAPHPAEAKALEYLKTNKFGQ